MINVELGGGTRGLPDYLNLDMIEAADIRIDLEEVGRGEKPLPFETRSVDHVYSAHCFEHVRTLQGLWHETARILRDDAPAQIIIPHWNQSMAMVGGHVHTISEAAILHLYEFPGDWWPECERWLRLIQIDYVPGAKYEDARNAFTSLSPMEIATFIPDTMHEVRYHFRAEPIYRVAPQDVLARIQRNVI